MKKILLLLIIVLFALFGCGSDANQDKEQDKAKEESATTENKEPEDIDKASSEDVEIIYPADIYGDQSEDEIIADFKEDGINDVTANDDGSYTLRMTKEEHNSHLKRLREEANADLDGIIESMGIEAIKEASMNDTVTELTVTVDRAMFEEDNGGIVLMDFALYAISYHVMSGAPDEDFNFEVVLIDDETGEEYERSSIFDEE